MEIPKGEISKNPVKFLIDHRDVIIKAYHHAGKSIKGAYELLGSGALPSIRDMAFNTFKSYITPFAKISESYENHIARIEKENNDLKDTVEQLNRLIKQNKPQENRLEPIEHIELNNINLEIKQGNDDQKARQPVHPLEHDQLKHDQLNRLIKQNKPQETRLETVELNNINPEIKQGNDEQMDVSFLMDRLDTMEARVETRIINQLKNELLKITGKIKQDETREKTKKTGIPNVGKWNIVFSGGYYRAFRNIEGKNKGVYIGATFNEDKAREKIVEKGYEVD